MTDRLELGECEEQKMEESIAFTLYLFERVLPYLVGEFVRTLWSLGPVKLLLGMTVLLGTIKALEIALWLLQRLWVPLAGLLAIGAVALATRA